MARANDPLPQPRILDSGVLDPLACPACFGALRLEAGGAGIQCDGCGRLYPLIDGIPVLIRERAVG